MKMERCNAGSCDHLFVFDPSVVVIDVKHRITTCELTYLVRVIHLFVFDPCVVVTGRRLIGEILSDSM